MQGKGCLNFPNSSSAFSLRIVSFLKRKALVWVKRIGENGRNRGEMIVFISCLSVAVPMVTICDGKECEEGRLMPDWDALYLPKWLLIGLGEPRTRRSRYSFSLLKCLLNCVQTVAGPGCLRRGWRCVTCLTRLAGKGLFAATPQPPAPARKAAARWVSVRACLQGGGSGHPGFFPPKCYLTKLDTGLAGIREPVPVPVCAGEAVQGGGLRAQGSSAGSLLAQR